MATSAFIVSSNIWQYTYITSDNYQFSFVYKDKTSGNAKCLLRQI